MVRRTKADVGADLPEKSIAYTSVALAPGQAAEYEHSRNRMVNELVSLGDPSELGSTLIAGLQELRRISTISRDGDSGKMDYVADEIEKIAERKEKAVVFSSFAHLALPTLVERLKPYGALAFTGEMSLEARNAAHEEFIENDDCTVMCASLKAAGVGLTWTVASYVYHLDLWWNPQVLRQAEDRVHRIGQRSPVIIKRLIAEQTLDEGLKLLLQAKEELFDFVIDGNGDAPSAGLALEQLLALVGLKLGASGQLAPQTR